jgi:butyrate kinase
MTLADPRILALNPGSTSTKISLFIREDETVSEVLRHSAEEVGCFECVIDQAEFRKNTVVEFLSSNEIEVESLDAVIGRGGLLRPLESGVYEVNDRMTGDLRRGENGEHASNLGAILAREIADSAGCPAFIADPVVVDEMQDIARLSGHPDLPRRSIFHALNQKSAAREAAGAMGRSYEECGIIVAHMGGGCSVGAHLNGRVVDVNNALDGDGPFSPERAGTVPAGQLAALVASGNVDLPAVKKMLTGRGGLVAYCGTNDLREVRGRMESGDEDASTAFRAMAYQIAKEIAAHGATLRGRVDVIVLTGGMAYDEELVRLVTERVEFLGKVVVIPGEREMLSLARAALSVLDGRVTAKVY